MQKVHRALRSRALIATVTALIAGTIGASTAVLATGERGVIDACVHDRDGGVRIVESAADCTKKEHHVTWDEQGPAGPPGADGAGLAAIEDLEGLACTTGDLHPGEISLTKRTPEPGRTTIELVCVGDGASLPSDQDEDGHPDNEDCAPHDSTIHPGAAERLNGVDDDCDGEIDEGFSQPVDCNDGDPYTDDAEEDGTCVSTPVAQDLDGDTYSATAATGSSPDCDDTNPDVHPAAVEVTADGIDNDCDGEVDETS